MLVVEAEEQVMLKVNVAEVQRTALKQLGVNLGAVLQSGSFSTTLLTDNSFPLTPARGSGRFRRSASAPPPVQLLAPWGMSAALAPDSVERSAIAD